MRKSGFILLFIFVLNPLTTAQLNKFSSEDIARRSMSILAPTTLKQLQWLPEEAAYSFAEDSVDESALLKGYAASGKKETIVTSEYLNMLLKKAGYDGSSSIPRIRWISGTQFQFWKDETLFEYDALKKNLFLINKLTKEAEEKSVSPDNKTVAFVKGNDLFISYADGNEFRVTSDGGHNITNGKSVSRNEFGIAGGIFWQQNGKLLAFYKEDLASVTDYPLLKIDTQPATVEMIKYPMAGQKSSKVSLHIFNIESKQTIKLNIEGDDEQYITSVTWHPSGNFIFAGILNRDQNHLKVIKFDAMTGEPVKILFEETDDKYVEPEHDLFFLPKDDGKFLWFSERNKWRHLYLYGIEGNLIKQLTNGSYVVTDFHGFDEAGENIFITTTEESPLERHFYKINLKTGLKTKLTRHKGVHNVKVHSSGFYFIDELSSLDTPNEIRIIDYKGDEISLIHKSGNPYEKYETGKHKIFSIKNEIGSELYCRIVYPSNFDSTKVYPAIVYVYGGPHAQLVRNEFPRGRYNLWFHRMASEGFVIFTLDNRGSDNRGLEFEQATFRRLGTIELEDQIAGVNYLKSQAFVDSNRLGVFGWSYGGFMSTAMMLRTGGMFKVGVNGGAVIDWRLYEVMYTERYMDTPQQNPDGYEESNLLNYADRLNGSLLLVHGTSDPVVVWQNTLAFADKAAKLNKPLDYFPYYGHGHHVGGTEGVHLFEKITNYFLEKL